MLKKISALLGLAFSMILMSTFDGIGEADDLRTSSSFVNLKIAENIESNENTLRSKEVKLAKLVRALIDSLCQQQNCENLTPLLQTEIAEKVVPIGSSLGNRILEKLECDTNFVKDCLYVADLKKNWQSVESKHFIFYFKDHNAPDVSKLREWDEHFERLSNTFGTEINEKIPYKIDKTEKYGRCFAPWNVRWGIRWRVLDDNPHELAHIMLFKYSDVPFFHEPLAFIYGTYKGDFKVVEEHWLKYEQIISDSGYVSSTEILHFPQLIGLEKSKWASAFYFVYQLSKEYGLEKLLKLMEITPWESSEIDYIKNFEKVYGFKLKEFEENILKEFQAK